MDIEITELTADRIDSARPLRDELAAHHAALEIPAGFRPRDADDGWTGFRARALATLDTGRGVVFLASSDGAAVGLAYTRLLDDAQVQRPMLVPTVGHAELVTLVVAATARGTGVGTALLERSEAWARDRGAGALHITVRGGNDEAQRLYERRGARAAFLTLVAPI